MTQKCNYRPAVVVLHAALLCALVGCASLRAKFPSQRSRAKSDDTSFAAGAGRAPTAATTYAYAKILSAQGRDRDALYVLNKVVRDHPSYIPAYNEIAGIYVRSDRLDDALDTLETGIRHSPNDSVLHNNLGMCHFLSGEHAQALEAFSQAVHLSPTNPTYRANRAAALAMLGRVDEAEADYRTVLTRRDVRVNLAALAKARAQQNGTQSKAEEAGASDDPDPADDAVEGDVETQGQQAMDVTAPVDSSL